VKRGAFRLASVLRVRRFQLDETARELAACQRQVMTAEQELHAREVQALRGRARVRDWVRRGVRAGKLQVATAGAERLAREMCDARALLDAARQQAEIAREALLTARTRVRSLEGLQQRLEREARAVALGIEQRELDEIGQRGWRALR